MVSAALLILLAACGAQSAPPPTAGAASQSAAPTAAASATAAAATAPAADANSDFAIVETTGADRLVRHMFGETRIPLKPQRIVAADLGTFVPTAGALAAVGVKPVAITADHIPAYLAAATADVQVLPGAPNYEAIAALKPDLIITPGVAYNRDNYNLLAQIAPTVAPPWYWQTLDQVTGYWTAVSTVVGQEAAGAQLVADLDGRIAAVRASLAPRMAGKTVSVLQVQGTGLEGVYLQTGRLESALLAAVGVARPANQTYDPARAEWYVTLSPELLPEANAWAIFAEIYAANPAEIPQAQQDLEASPLWGQLAAVKGGRVFYVATDEWSGTDPLLAKLVLDTIERRLTTALDAEGS
jgi:iron complex transport system substrate-binding protein